MKKYKNLRKTIIFSFLAIICMLLTANKVSAIDNFSVSVNKKANICYVTMDASKANNTSISYDKIFAKCDGQKFKEVKYQAMMVESGENVQINKATQTFTFYKLDKYNVKSSTKNVINVRYKVNEINLYNYKLEFIFTNTKDDQSKSNQVCCRLQSGENRTYSGTSCNQLTKINDGACASSNSVGTYLITRYLPKSDSSTTYNLKQILAQRLGKSESEITSLNFVSRVSNPSNKLFLNVASSGSTNIRITINQTVLKELSNGAYNELKLNYTLKDKSEQYSMIFRVVVGNATTDDDENKIYCWYNPTTKKYTTMTKASKEASQYGSMLELKENISADDCKKQNRATSSTTTTNTSTSSNAGSSSSTGNTGKNACTEYTIKRVRSYNSNKSEYASINKTDYSFYSPVNNFYNYYYVYKAYASCSNFDSSTEITSFCIDPGLSGPTTTGTSYHASSKKVISKDKSATKFERGIYWLYKHWHLDNADNIKNAYSGSSPNGRDDFLDYVSNNVARMLIANYGEEFGIGFGLKTGQNGNTSYSLKMELDGYNQKEFNPSSSLASSAKQKLLEVWNNVKDYAEGKISEDESSKKDEEIVMKMDASNPTMLNSNRGFEVQFVVKMKSDNDKLLEEAIASKKITIVTKSGINIPVSDSEITIVNDWSTDSEGYRTATFKVKKEDISADLGDDESVSLRFNIEYTSRASMDNILILESNDQNASSGGTYQKFITFLNGKISKYDGTEITMSKSLENTCKAVAALPCTNSESVFYLIEGTQSGTLFNTVMSGINTIGDLKNLVSDAYNIIQYLQNRGNQALNVSDIKIISSFLYSISNNTGISKRLKKELSFLVTLSNNGNQTAGALYNALSSSVFFNDNSKENYSKLVSFLVESLLNASINGYDKVEAEFDEIVEAASETKISKSTKELLENINNAIKSAGDSETLKKVLNGSLSVSEYLQKYSNLTEIQSSLLSFGSVAQTVVGTIGEKLSDVGNYIQKMLSQVNIAKNLGDVSNIFDSITNALTVDWQKCIIGTNGVEATDPDGNSYTVKTSNSYCSIVCKEDYAFKMPGNLGVTYAGRYISTNLDDVYHATVGVAGQRTCVTTSVNNDKYLNDAAETKTELLNSYNSFMKSYLQFKNLDNFNAEVLDEKVKYDATMADTNSVITNFKAQFLSSLSNVANTFIASIVGNSTSDMYLELQRKFSDELGNFAIGIAAKWLTNGGNLDDKEITDAFSSTVKSTFDDKYEEYKDKIEKAVKNAEAQIKIEAKVLAERLLKDALDVAIDVVFKTLFTTVCNGSPLFDLLFPGLGEGVKGACELYATVSNGFKDGVTAVNNATQSTVKLFNQKAEISYSYTYDTYKFSDSSNNEAILSSKFVIDQANISESSKTSSSTRKLLIMNHGDYFMHSFHFGAYFNYDNLAAAINSISEIYNNGTIAVGSIKSAYDKITTASGIMEKPSLGNLGSIKSIGDISSIIDVLNNLFDVINADKAAISYAASDLTNLLDRTLDFYYYVRGAFDPYYSTLASIRNDMKKYKSEYDAARSKLTTEANQMNSCTIWEQDFRMDPEITFTYGYQNNNLLDYIISKKNTTADTIKLEAINKQTTANVSTYYCYKDVGQNKMQSWENLLSGTCVTNDDIFGGIVSALLGSDNFASNIVDWFKNNADGFKTLLSDSRIQEYLQNNEYYQSFTTAICNKSEALCNILNINENGTVNTYIPGEIVYDFAKTGKNIFSNVSSSIKSGNFKNLESDLVGSLYYTTQSDQIIKYRNVKLMATISRYGNPGISMSGVNIRTVAANIANWLASKLNMEDNEVISKINEVLDAVSGQEFIYYKSSQPYWTSSNKGIYTKAEVAPDSVIVDIGDPALTDSKIKSGTGDSKAVDGRIYPIALSTTPGKYSYQIKFNNIGQYYNNTYSLGRIVDDNGYVSGLLANQYVCTYEVKTEPDTVIPSCEDILKSSDCQNDDEKSYLDLFLHTNKDDKLYEEYENKANACINKLLADGDTCCSYVEATKVPASNEIYNNVCNNHCQGIKLYGEDSALQTTITTNNSSALIGNNGTLQFYTKVVSNYDLFPNGNTSKGYNWSGKTSGYENKSDDGTPGKQDLSNIIEQIEDVGDGIYADDEKYLEYSITMNSACMNAIKTYNKNQEIIDLGFGDYSASSISKESREYKSQFLADIQSNSEYSSCKIDSYLK